MVLQQTCKVYQIRVQFPLNPIKQKLNSGITWNLKDESIKYCKLDCQCLHQVLVKFNELIFNEFKVNIHSVLTLPALAMKIYKIHYMKENTIYQLLGIPEFNIRQSYTGVRRSRRCIYSTQQNRQFINQSYQFIN